MLGVAGKSAKDEEEEERSRERIGRSHGESLDLATLKHERHKMPDIQDRRKRESLSSYA